MQKGGTRRARGQKSYLAKVFKNGGSQAIRLPKACRVDGTEVRIRPVGKRLVVEPLPAREARDAQPDPSWSDAFVRAFFRGGERSFIDRTEQGRKQRRDPID